MTPAPNAPFPTVQGAPNAPLGTVQGSSQSAVAVSVPGVVLPCAANAGQIGSAITTYCAITNSAEDSQNAKVCLICCTNRS